MTNPIVVIGSNSFSGANFCKHCLDQGQPVIGISRSEEQDHVFLPQYWTDHQNFTFRQLDVNTDHDAIVDLLYSTKPSHIINFAAQSMVAQSWETPEDWMNTNVVAMVKLHNALKNASWLEKYVHISTPEVYGSCEGYINEHENYHPSTPYAASRAACDLSLRTFIDAYDFPCVFTRAANVYGPGQQLYRIIPKTILSIKLNEKISLHGGGTSVRSFIHMDDVSRATYNIALNAPIGEIYHIATKQTISIKDLVAKICDLMSVDFNDYVDTSDERLGKDSAYLLSSEKIRNTLEWSDKISLTDGIKDVITWVDNNLDILEKSPREYKHKR